MLNATPRYLTLANTHCLKALRTKSDRVSGLLVLPVVVVVVVVLGLRGLESLGVDGAHHPVHGAGGHGQRGHRVQRVVVHERAGEEEELVTHANGGHSAFVVKRSERFTLSTLECTSFCKSIL